MKYDMKMKLKIKPMSRIYVQIIESEEQNITQSVVCDQWSI